MTVTIDIGGGQIVEFPDTATAQAYMQRQRSGQTTQPAGFDMAQSETNMFEQSMNGVNEGLAGFLGAPVDLVNAGLNAGISGVNNLTGTEIPPITDPVGGSGTFERLMQGWAISQTPPQNTAQRYGRRIGREVGFGAPAAVATGGMYSGSALGRLMVNNAMADTAAGVAGQTAREIAPESALADIFASTIAGGGTAALRAGALKSRPDAPHATTDEMFDAAGQAYRRAEDSGVQLSRSAQEELFDRLYGRLKDERATPRRHPRAFDAIEEAKNWPNARLTDIEETRSIIGRDVASNADEAGIGVALKQEIDDYLNSLDATRMVGPNPEQALAGMREGRALTHQAHKARAVEGQEYRAQSRAATSGTGGNQVNAMRQNVRRILDNEVAPTRSGRSSGYTPDEIAQMEKIVFGSPGQNRLRWASRFAPSAGVLPASITSGLAASGGVGALMTGNPLPMLAIAPGFAAEGAKRLAERSTRRDIEELLDIVRRGGVAAPKTISPTGTAVRAAGGLSSLDALTRP
ncbi:hypothetical protein [Tateyamaria sp.]|uniref:hypothetical protein n=1 Tax=Tateyamaria sp. TaxID=1929288 RepID=UPI003B217B44